MLLLDASVIAWWFLGDKRLGRQLREVLCSPTSQLVVSLLTLFELELKISAGKLTIPGRLTDFLEKFDVGVYRPMAHELPELLHVNTGHRDPYDRALVGLAVLKGWDVVTSDELLINLLGQPIKIIDSRK